MPKTTSHLTTQTSTQSPIRVEYITPHNLIRVHFFPLQNSFHLQDGALTFSLVLWDWGLLRQKIRPLFAEEHTSPQCCHRGVQFCIPQGTLFSEAKQLARLKAFSAGPAEVLSAWVNLLPWGWDNNYAPISTVSPAIKGVSCQWAPESGLRTMMVWSWGW